MMDEDSFSRQRREIIEKYEVGAIKNASDDWENPQYTIYAITDYYGFLHDSGLTKEFENKENKIIKLDTKRESKWKKLMVSKKNKDSSSAYTENPFGDIYLKLSISSFREEIKKRVYKGIPKKFKGPVWNSLLQIRKMKSENPDVYKNMLAKALAKSPDIHQIDLDVNRTFRNTTYFRERYNARQKALLNVLAAYSMYNTEIGYCQGMSEIAGLLLMYLWEEEDVFWALSQLMTKAPWCMHGLFVAGFPRLLTFFDHLSRIMHKLLPKLAKHFDKLDVFTSSYALKWFMQCYLDRVPLTLFLRLWDIYMLEGEQLLLGMAYNLLKMHKKRLLKMDHASILCFLQADLKKDFMYEDDVVIESLKRCLEELKRYNLVSPPRPKQDELPLRPFGTDSHFQTPSPAAIKQRQAEQSNPEAAVRKSLKQRRQSNRDTIGSNHNNHIKSITEINEPQNATPNNDVHNNQPNIPEVYNNQATNLTSNDSPSNLPSNNESEKLSNHVDEISHVKNDEPAISPAKENYGKRKIYSNRPKSSSNNTPNNKASVNRYSYPNHQKSESTTTEYYTVRSQVNNTTSNTTSTIDNNGKQKIQSQNVKYRIHHKVPKSNSLYLNSDEKSNADSIIRPKSTNPAIIVRPNKLKSSHNQFQQRKQPVIRYHYNKSAPNLNSNQDTPIKKPANSSESNTINRSRPNSKYMYNTSTVIRTSDNTTATSSDSLFHNKSKHQSSSTHYFPANSHINNIQTNPNKANKISGTNNKYLSTLSTPETVV